MSGFWGGFASALIGALVGGVFTALGAILQSRSTIRAVILQLEESRKVELESARRQHLQRIATDLLIAAQTVCDTLWREADSHVVDSEAHDADSAWKGYRTSSISWEHSWDLWRPFVPTRQREDLDFLSENLACNREGFEKESVLPDKPKHSPCGYCNYLVASAEKASYVRSSLSDLLRSLTAEDDVAAVS